MKNPILFKDSNFVEIFNLNLNCADYITLCSSATIGMRTFLVDSQADISILRISALSHDTYIDSSKTIRIRGVTDELIQSLGTIEDDLLMNNFSISHEFHVVPDNFHIPADGIIGKDFLKLHKCTLDYDQMSLSFSFNGTQIFIPIRESPTENVITLPARSEVFRTFRLAKYSERQFINNHEIAPGVFISNTIANSANPIIRVLNTTSQVVSIKNTLQKSENLSNFNIFTINQNQSNNARIEALTQSFKRQSPKSIHDKLLPLLSEYSDIFALASDKMTQNNFYEQKLRLSDVEPVYAKNYRLPKTQKNEINKQVQKLRENDLIEPSVSSYNSPLILVPKKSTDGIKKWRMCVDYRQLNKKLIADKFPLPRIDEILDGLGRAKYFSCLDLFSGFHQIKLDKNSREYTAFSTEAGTFQWKVLPFGLNVAPNSFCRMMSLAFAGLPPEQAFLYMDDLIVIGTSENNHLRNLENVFKICRQCNLKLNPEKCEFFRGEVTFLGHKCTQNGLLPDDTKTEVIEKYPRPTDKEAVKRFVAFCNYYRRFIKNFAEKANSLNKLTRKRSPFVWTDECEDSFQSLKAQLIRPPILQYPDFQKPFVVTVDASNFASGAVLSQEHDGRDLPICFISRSFQKGELNKPIIEKELLAIHFAITYLRPYLYGTKFRVRSDHRPLIYLYNMKNPASKLTRIRLDLEEYDFEIEYIKGKDNVTADALSRISIADLKKIYENNVTMLPVMTRSMHRKLLQQQQQQTRPSVATKSHAESNKELTPKVIENDNIFLKKIPKIIVDTNMKLKMKLGRRTIFDIDLSDVITNDRLDLGQVLTRLESAAGNRQITECKWPMNDEIFSRISISEFKNASNRLLSKMRIILYRSPRKITDDDEKSRIIKAYHDDPISGGHFGRNKLYSKLKELYHWSGMSKDIARYVSNCQKCLLNKVRSATREPMKLTPTPQAPFDVIIIDTIGPLQQSDAGNKYAVTMICDLTKYLISVPVRDKTAKSVARAICENFVLKYGPMKQIRTDMGTEYKNELLRELCKLLKIEHFTSTAYHHQSVGSIERSHRTFNEYIRAFVTDMSNWDDYLHYFTFLYNTTGSECFSNKFTPFELVFGKKANQFEFIGERVDPLYNEDDYAMEVKYRLQLSHVRAKRLLDKLKLRNKQYYDRNSRTVDFQIGDRVLLRREPYDKHCGVYSGPYLIHEMTDQNVTIVEPDGNKRQLVHKNRVVRI